LGLNALREAAETWCSCEDVFGSNSSECEVQAKAQYEVLGGNPAEWDATEQAQARDIANGLFTGDTTKVFRMNSTDLIFRLGARCSTLDLTAAHNAFLAFVTSVNSNLVGYNISAPWESNAICQMKYRVELKSVDMTIDALTSTLQAHTMTVTSTTRRSTITASTSTSQTTSLCTVMCTIATSAPTNVDTTLTTFVVYHLSNFGPTDFSASTTRGSVLRTSAVEAFDQVQDQANSSQFMLGSVSGTRRSGVELTFVITGIGVVNITSLNIAITNTGSSGFAQVFFTKATAAGQTVSLPVVTFVRWYYTQYTSGDSSDAFPVWVIFFIVFIVVMIALAILVFFVQRNRAADDADTRKLKKESKDADIEKARHTSPGIPTTIAQGTTNADGVRIGPVG